MTELIPISDISCFHCQSYSLVVDTFINECSCQEMTARCLVCGEVYYKPIQESMFYN